MRGSPRRAPAAPASPWARPRAPPPRSRSPPAQARARLTCPPCRAGSKRPARFSATKPSRRLSRASLARLLAPLAGRGLRAEGTKRARRARVRGRIRLRSILTGPLTLAPLRCACLAPDKGGSALSPHGGERRWRVDGACGPALQRRETAAGRVAGEWEGRRAGWIAGSL